MKIKENEDIYFDLKYAKTYEQNNEGKVKEFIYENCLGSGKIVFLEREIPIKINEKKYYDITTPYGYGGPIFKIEKNIEKNFFLDSFFSEFENYCKENNIISSFIRFHPLEKNYMGLEKYMELEEKSHTVAINLESLEVINKNLEKKCKKNLKKALKEKLTLKISSSEAILDFFELYKETMDKNSANKYYYFDINYFENLFENLDENIKIFSVYRGEDIVASSIIFLGSEFIHAHLGGNNKIAYDIGARTYLYLEIAKWGMLNNYKYFHLGGGYGGDESSLYKFKKGFNKNEEFKFIVGKKIFNTKIYDTLAKEIFVKDKNYFPAYRG